MFVDECEITVSGGRGGDGCLAFLREKFRPQGGPSGGDGGRGGDVVFVASDVVDTLLAIRRMAQIQAENGKPGANKKMHGRRGREKRIRVPLGTIIVNSDNGSKLMELTEPGQVWVAAKGGKPGRGNPHFATAKNRAPRKVEQGRPGQKRKFHLELKLIADVGLVGLPNAGKSTLLNTISAARSKIANYPFTTLSPAPGVVEIDRDNHMVVADLPGLIEGASKGLGLGAEFLRHTERTGVILHLIDLVPEDGSDPAENYRKIRGELDRYSEKLASKCEIIAGSKCDLTGAEAAAEKLTKKLKKKIITFSAATSENLEELKLVLWKQARAEREARGQAQAPIKPKVIPPHLRQMKEEK